MDSEELRETLQDAGLSPYQSQAYVAMLELGTASARDLVAESDVPDPRIYDVVRSLEDRGYVETYEQDTLRVRAHDPAEVLADLQSRAGRLEDAAAEIEDRWEQPELDAHAASIVQRFETVVDRARMFIEDAENQIQLSASPEQFAVLEDALAGALDRGVYVQLSLYTDVDEADAVHGDAEVEGATVDDGDATSDGGGTLPSRDQLARTATEVRHRPIPSPFMALVDRQKACFAPHEAARNEYGVLVDDRTHEYVFHWYYVGCLWEICDEIYSARNDDPPIEYVDVREFIRDVEPIVNGDDVVEVRVEGNAVRSGEPMTIAGVVSDVYYEGDEAEGARETGLVELAGRASFTVACADDEYTVGGEGAMLEDVEAMRITVTEVA